MMGTTHLRLLADWYSGSGKDQVLVAVYRNEAVLYAQVSAETAALLRKKFETYRYITFVGEARSGDGLTSVFGFKRSRDVPRKSNWVQVVMGTLAPFIQKALVGLLVDGQVNYVDNQWRDTNSVESFAALLSSIPNPD